MQDPLQVLPGATISSSQRGLTALKDLVRQEVRHADDVAAAPLRLVPLPLVQAIHPFSQRHTAGLPATCSKTAVTVSGIKLLQVPDG